MKWLTPLDSAFFWLERRQQPFHVGALMLFEPPKDAPADFVCKIAERLSASDSAATPFNRRLVTKMGLGYWVEDEHFDMAHHFVHLSLPAPGRIRELLQMVSRVHSAHLDRAYPLWRTYLIEGLEDGRIAMYSKIHHGLVDGIAGMRLMMKSMAPDAQSSLQMPPPWQVGTNKSRNHPPPVPMRGLAGFGAATGLAREGLRSVPAVAREIQQTVRDAIGRNPDLVLSYQAPRCILNRKVTASRRFAAQSYSRKRIKAVAERVGASSNDVILAMCGGALRRYLQELNDLPDKPLIALVPVSTRRDDSDSGNQVAMALANLATHLSDPAERLRTVKASMDYIKQRFQNMSPAQLLAYSAARLTPGVMATYAGVDSKRSIANLVISHVPGPQQELYWQGARLDGVYPASIVIDGFALNITLVSRHDNVDVGIIACRRNLPSVQRLLEFLEDDLAALENAVK